MINSNALKAFILATALILPTSALAQVEIEYPRACRDAITFMDTLPGTGDNIMAVVKVTPDGTMSLVGVGCQNHNQPAQEQLIKSKLIALKKLPPLPTAFSGKPLAWMTFSWDNSKPLSQHASSSCISGPYFHDVIDDDIKYQINMLQKPYKLIIESKILSNGQSEQSEAGDAVVYIKLKPQGEIAAIKITASSKNVEQKSYAAVLKSHPFGAVPTKLGASPCFKIHMRWGTSGMISVGAEQIKVIP